MPRYGIALITVLISGILAGCGGNSTGTEPPPPEKGSILVKVTEHPGKSLPGFEVTVEPPPVQAITDSSGKALVEDLEPGTYTLSVRKEGYPATYSGSYFISADYLRTVAITFIPRVAVTVTDDRGRPCQGAMISTDPPSREVVTGADGIAVFEYIALLGYQFIVHRDKAADEYFSAAAAPELQFTVPTAAPSAQILQPADNTSLYSLSGITLRGTGSDWEDGALTGESLEWSSDRDGVLGRGGEITVDLTTPGAHVITLTATDSDGKTGSASTRITVYDYNLDTYFPTPINQTWKYRCLVPQFSVTTETGDTEYWNIKDISVIVAPGPRRRVEMQFAILRDEKTFTCRYIITDFLETAGDLVYITSTDERYEEGETSTPSLEMDIHTTYSPKYLLLKNIKNPGGEPSWTTQTEANTNWSYISNGQGSSLYQEWKPFSVTVETGPAESVATDKGDFTAIPVTIRESTGLARIWYLAHRVGPVRFTDNSFSPQMVAVLEDASILGIQKNIGPSRGVAKTPASPPHLDIRINRETGENMRKLTDFLAHVSPR